MNALLPCKDDFNGGPRPTEADNTLNQATCLCQTLRYLNVYGSVRRTCYIPPNLSLASARQLEQRIRQLCLRLIATDESGDFEALAQQLREAIHAHIEELRCTADRLALVHELLLSLEPTPEMNK